jgi:hypothetical protein
MNFVHLGEKVSEDPDDNTLIRICRKSGVKQRKLLKFLEGPAMLVALFTTLFASLAAVSGIFSSQYSTRAVIAKSEANYYQDMASNEWAFYQSRNIRKEIAEVAGLLAKSSQFAHQKEVLMQKYEAQKPEVTSKARDYENQRNLFYKRGELYTVISQFFMISLILFQLGLLFVPICLYAKRTRFLFVGLIFGIFGLSTMVYAFSKTFLTFL